MIRIVTKDPNRIGDLFAERMTDLIHAIGFDINYVNIHRTGRELDIIATHRLEGRKIVIECKAQEEKVGGGEVNKFVGALDAEKRRLKSDTVVGYFISMSGFRDSAIAQEEDVGNSRCVLMDHNAISKELQSAGVVVPYVKAATLATSISRDRSWQAMEDGSLLATDFGWVWLVKYHSRGEPQAYTYIHSDGHQLPNDQAEELANLQQGANSGLSHYLPPRPRPLPNALRAEYLSYLGRECGAVTYEGLPADPYLGTGLSLDEVYVPLYVEEIRDERKANQVFEGTLAEPPTPTRRTVGEALAANRHISIVGPPGCGKSTLMARIALTYSGNAGDSFRSEARLPGEDLLPLLIRCRDLGNSQASFTTLIDKLSQQFGDPVDKTSEFRELVTQALRHGHALLLIDGLDEVASPAQRVALVREIRNLLSTYPMNRLLLTSREPGFRPVAGVLADYCNRYRLAELDDDSIVMLIEHWSDLVPTRSNLDRKKPQVLADRVLGSARIRRLASNPLLLTTLLMVERWVGDLPRRRSVLYDKAIEVLLVSWNVEGHQPLNQDEVLPQLGYVAHAMTEAGSQVISTDHLTELLHDARQNMPDILAYVKLSPTELVERIESRSSLLSQAGFAVESGRLQPTFEFKHLAFQEYLTALACAKGWNPAGLTTADPDKCLGRHYFDEPWIEVIPLAAVLSGRAATGIVENLIDHVEAKIEEREDADEDLDDLRIENNQRISSALEMLAGCISDEASVRPDAVRRALAICIDYGTLAGFGDWTVEEILNGRFGAELRMVAKQGCLSPRSGEHTSDYPAIAGQILEYDIFNSEDSVQVVETVRNALTSDDTYCRLAACALLTAAAYRASQGVDGGVEYSESHEARVRQAVLELRSDVLRIYEDRTSVPELIAYASWALAWIYHDTRTNISTPTVQRILARACELAFVGGPTDLHEKACWLISQNCVKDRSELLVSLSDVQQDAIRQMLEPDAPNSMAHEYRAALVLAYLGQVLTGQLILQLLDAAEGPESRERSQMIELRQLLEG